MQIPLVETNRDKVQEYARNASEALYKMAKASYGPKAGNAVLGYIHGAPQLSRDGVTNIKQVRLENPFEDDIVQTIKQISEKNNLKRGDGTTGVVVLAHHLLVAAQKMDGKVHHMEIAAKLKEAEKIALAYIDSIKIPVKDDTFLERVATIAAGDPELGAMIADIMKEVGKDGGVLIEQYEGLGVHNEVMDGFYFPGGYKDTDLINDPTANQSDHHNVPILISNKTFNTEIEIAPVLNDIARSGIKELILIGEVNGLALETLKMTRAKGIMITVPIDPPYVVGGRSLFLDDIALMTGGEIYNGIDFKVGMLGMAKEVLINGYSTTILDGDGDKELIKSRIESLKEQLKEEEHPQSIQFIKDRLARLTGKTAIIRVGGAIEFERDEVKLRVQDAVCAVQSAMKDGILPGGGVTLAKVQGTEFDDAFRQPFKQLVENAGLNPELYMGRLEGSLAWEGFNLRRITDTPVNMLEEGVIDPSLVISEIVTNAIAVVSGLITASAAIAHPIKE